MLRSYLERVFPGVREPIAGWLVKRVAEFFVLSPLIALVWIWLRFGKKEVLIVGNLSNTISQFIAPLEPELRRRSKEQGLLGRSIVLNLSSDANSQVRQMYDRIVKIYGNEAKLFRRLIWWASQYGVRKKLLNEEKSNLEWIEGAPVTSFSVEEEIRGGEYLASLGLEKFKYVCFTVRSESYYLARISEGQRLLPNTVRNPSEANYLRIANELGSCGVKVLRMGKDMPITASVGANLHTIDYATQFRTEFLDIYLMKYCKFAFIGNTGIFWIRKMFNAATVHCDMYQIKHVPIAPDIFIIQKLWLVNEHRLATFKEMLGIKHYSVEKRMELLGVELVKNTVEEIKAVCDEMNARIDGTWVTTEEDEELQRRYQELIVKHSNKPEWNGGGRIGAQFLRENQDLLRE